VTAALAIAELAALDAELAARMAAPPRRCPPSYRSPQSRAARARAIEAVRRREGLAALAGALAAAEGLTVPIHPGPVPPSWAIARALCR
jgi:hypothetical protein